MHLSRVVAAAVALSAGCSIAAMQAIAETVGKAVSVKTMVTGDRGELKRADPVSRDERIRTNNIGLGQFQFIDGTKLAVGPNSSIVIDEYVLGERNRVKKLTINATKGAFRWISGRSPSSAYEITTPVGSLGVRGTAFDVFVGGDTAMMVLLSGSGEWCTDPARRNCVIVDRPCQFIVARRGGVSDPQPVSRGAINQFGAAAAFPFLINNRQLLSSYRLGRNNCGMGGRVGNRSNDSKVRPERSRPERSTPPGDGCQECSPE
jgi:hypothetical protein